MSDLTPELQHQMELAGLGVNANQSLDIIVKLLQIIWYIKELNGDEDARKMSKKFDPMIEQIMGEMDKQMQNFVRRYGEL